MAEPILKRLEYNQEFRQLVCNLVKTNDDNITAENIQENYELSLIKYKIQVCDSLAHHPDKIAKIRKYLNKIERLLKGHPKSNLILIAAIGKKMN